MNVKEFLLSLDFEKLHRYYYRNSIAKDVVLVEEAKKTRVSLRKKNKLILEKFFKQIQETDIKETTSERLMVMRYFDYDYTDDLEMYRTTIFDALILNMSECKKLPRFNKVNTIAEVHNNPRPWSSYSLMFVPWEEILGLEIAYLPKAKYAAATAIIDELTFFGYDKEENDARVQEETAELNRISAEIDNGTAKFVEYNPEEFRKEFDLPEKTPEQEAKENALSQQIMIDNINEDYRVYNLLRKKGFWDDIN